MKTFDYATDGGGEFEAAVLSEFKPLPADETQYTIEFIENNQAIVLKETEERVWVGVCDPDNFELTETLSHYHSKPIRFFRLEKSDLAAFLAEKLSGMDAGAPGGRAAREKILIDKIANDAPVINLINSLLIEAIRKNASDIHIECFSDDAVVRYRIDGYLKTVLTFEKDKFPAVSSRIKIMANLNIMEKRLPQDGRITVHLENDIIDLRVSIVPIAEGESVVLRLFNKKKSPLELDQLGLPNKELGLLRDLSRRHHGLILVTGPTGSGKTTTLNAVLRKIKSDTQKIITIEDPIEYSIDGINQIQTNEKIGLTFDSILRRVLRQDPDIIMVGEIRDAQTAELAIRASLTGHLVFSTLHTNDSVSAISRLKNMGVEPFLLAAVFRASLAQRLARRICPDCRERYTVSPAEASFLKQNGSSRRTLYRGRGCASCSQTGYRGRTGLFEIFTPDEQVEDMIVKDVRDSEIKQYLVSKGMTTLMKAGMEKILEGTTTVEEVERVVTI
ncbi:MAG TPA: type II/IV secretion system protein [Spirochaetia bacterium]|nr:type II/IV secretion system protein [Spirochaetia bacterium]